ncbi:MAG: SRPBCC family protein [Actinomycetota bacterium]|nr:SRPBCC family protein [Actinomycetota bacterium]
MIRLTQRILIDDKPKKVFALISDPSRYPDFFVGITRWKPMTKKKRGQGARYRVLMAVGSIEAGGTVKVERWDEDVLITWGSEAGVEQRGRWELHPTDDGTELLLQVEFALSGGPVGWAVERLAGRTVARNMWATLLAARRLIELERS